MLNRLGKFGTPIFRIGTAVLTIRSIVGPHILTLGHPRVIGYSVTEGVSNLPILTGIRLEALNHPDQPFQGPGRSYWGTFAISEFKLFRKWPGKMNGLR